MTGTEPVIELQDSAPAFEGERYEYPDASENPPNLDRFYGSLRNYVRMVARGYHGLLMLDASGGLGKTYNVMDTLKEELRTSEWIHQKGFTTPVELYKTLWSAQERDTVLFLDDMSGLRHNQKAIDMLKAATETDGEENWIEYRSSQSIPNPENPEEDLPQTFCFRGSIVMSFNDTPENEDFNALKDRCVANCYHLTFDHAERLDLIREVAKIAGFSELTVPEQQECAEWIASVTNPAITVSLRTLEQVCSMRHFGREQGQDWERMALDAFDLDYEKHLIIQMRKKSDMSVAEQRERFCQQTGQSESHYYELFNEIKSERMG